MTSRSDSPPDRAQSAVTAAPSSASHATDGAATEDESERIAKMDAALAEAALKGTEELKRVWGFVRTADKPILKAALDKRHKPAAEQADAEATR